MLDYRLPDGDARDVLRELTGRLESLSPREREVLELIVDGRLNK